MSLEDICGLDIGGLAAKNAVLFLWSVWPRIFDARAVIESWGFQYKTKAFTWVKSRRNGFGFHFGMGYYTRANDEPCLLATRGNMPVAVHDELALIYSPVREHSRKPDEQYGKIERLYPGRRYLELFARRRRSGWDVFGNQVEGSISLPIPSPAPAVK
jgi:N6-adenosine-specific RNA methylase IME4